jgi:hypothetical protein
LIIERAPAAAAPRAIVALRALRPAMFTRLFFRRGTGPNGRGRFTALARVLRARPSTLDPLRDTETPAASFERTWRPAVKQRVVILLVSLGLWGAGIEARLVQLQVFQHEELSKQARKRQQQRIPQPALRGDILDRNGEVLAYSVDADMIVADPSLVKHPEYTAAALCAALGDCSPADQTEFAAKLAAPGKYVQIRQARSVSPEQVARVSALKLSGIALKDEPDGSIPATTWPRTCLASSGSKDTGRRASNSPMRSRSAASPANSGCASTPNEPGSRRGSPASRCRARRSS